jgi:dTMP kinase
MNRRRFIAVEGPNGVGKTTSAATLYALLQGQGTAALLTTEPSDTSFGRLVRSSESGLSGRALALAVAADRTAHIDNEIQPAINAGQVVISDRYVQSSLVLQRIDGLTLSEIWQYNQHVPQPTVSFYLQLGAETIQARLNERGELSRLERLGSPARELALYHDAYDFLDRRGWRQIKVDCRDLAPEEVAAQMLDYLADPTI